jgi:hypothetical protein
MAKADQTLHLADMFAALGAQSRRCNIRLLLEFRQVKVVCSGGA